MKNLFIIGLIFSLIFVNSAVFSQNYELNTKLQKDTILIGEQILFNINIKKSNKTKVIFPTFKDTISKKIEVIATFKENEKSEGQFNFLEKNYVITSFDTGNIVIPKLNIVIIENGDSSKIQTKEQQIFVQKFVVIDTIPRDTTYAKYSGFVVRGHNGFKEEIEKYIPDSIRKSLPADSLRMLEQACKEQLSNIFSSQLTQQTGLADPAQIQQIIDAPKHALFLADKSGILDEYAVLGNLDSLYVQEFQQVEKNQIVFTSFKIKDIVENQYNTPYDFSEFLYDLLWFFQYFWWIFILIGIGIVIYFVIKYKKKHQTIRPPIFRKKIIPAHIIALEKLENIRVEKLWSKGLFKEYHVQISDTVREYLENRFGINITDMTTTEILNTIKTTKILNNTNFDNLKFILQTADLVKFAKYQPLQLENDNSLQKSFDLVNDTKEVLENPAV